MKRNPKAVIIAIVAVVLIAVIAFLVLRFAFPDIWNGDLSNPDSGQSTPNTPTTPITPDKPSTPTTPDTIVDSSLQLPESGLTFAEGDLSVHMVNVGQGDCILILFPDGKEMLIDCANYNNTTSIRNSAFAYLDMYVTNNQIDYVMLTHCDSDHVYFLDEVLDKYQVDNVYMPNVLAAPTSAKWQNEIAALDDELVAMFTDKDTVDSACYAEFFCAALTEPNCNVVLNVDPDENKNSIIIEGEGYKLTFYCPTQEYYDTTNLNSAEKKNAISPIGVLEYNGFRLVVTGDSNEINEPIFVRRIGGSLDCDVLKVGHHGSETSSTPAFLDAITCEYAFISCNAAGNKFNHPRQTTLDRFIARDMAIYRTDNNGSIVFVFNTEITVYVETRVEQETNRQGLV